MELEVARILLQGSTSGKLIIDGAPFCDTLEDPVREQRQPDGSWLWRSEFKIKTRTAIPSGRYEVMLTFSQRFQKRLPLIVGVPDFDGIRIHGGNTVEDTEGCLLVGQRTGPQVTLSYGIMTSEKLMGVLSVASEFQKIFITFKNVG
jgi:hypothetical protein